MASETRPFRSAAMALSLALALICLGSLSAAAQDAVPAAGDTAQIAEPELIRHPSALALSGAFCYWGGLHILKENVYDVNDLTDGGFAGDLGLRWYALDGLAISLHAVSGGMNFTDTKPGETAAIPIDGLSSDAYLEMKGLSFGLQAYLGQKLFPDSKFNPYMKGSILYMDWSLLDESGGESLVFDNEPLEGTNAGVGFGLGTEYDLGDTIDLEFEWLWNYLLTEDDTKWDEESMWTNTHYWTVSAGVIWNF